MIYTNFSEGFIINYLIIGLEDGTILFLDTLTLKTHASIQTDDLKYPITNISLK
jgi:hypothetical protein